MRRFTFRTHKHSCSEFPFYISHADALASRVLDKKICDLRRLKVLFPEKKIKRARKQMSMNFNSGIYGNGGDSRSGEIDVNGAFERGPGDRTNRIRPVTR